MNELDKQYTVYSSQLSGVGASETELTSINSALAWALTRPLHGLGPIGPGRAVKFLKKIGPCRV